MSDRDDQAARPRSALGHRDFLLFTGGHATSAFGDAVSQTALPLLVLHLTGSGTSMGLVATLQALPMIVFGFIAGVIADRWNRRRTMQWCDIGRALLVGCVPVSVLLAIPTMGVLYAIVVPVGLLWVLFEAASHASVPVLAGRDRLAEANAYLSVASSIGYVLGPGFAGLLVGAIGAGCTLGVDALTFAISAACLMSIRSPFQEARPPATGAILAGMREGFTFISRHRGLRAMLAYWSVVFFATAPLVVCVTFYITRDLAMSERALGLAISAYAVGAVLGALVGARIPARHGGSAMVGGTTAAGLAILGFSGTDRLWIALALALLAGASESMAIVFYGTLRAQLTPDHLLGRVISTARVLTFGLQPLSLFLAGVLLDLVGGALTLALIGGLSLAASIAFWLAGGVRALQSRDRAVDQSAYQ
jgi:MFS family permease